MNESPTARPFVLSAAIGFASLLPLAGGCASARAEIDPQLAASAPEQPIEGAAWAQLHRPVKFGAYTGKITRGGWTQHNDTQAGPYERHKTKQNLEYEVTGAPASWAGACSYASDNRAVLFPINDDAGLVCTMVPQGAAGWQLQLNNKGGMYVPKTLVGSMTDGTTTLSIAMLHKLAGSGFKSARPVGYELRDASGASIAAVQTFNPYIVWIDPKLPAETQNAIAAGVFGLLFSSAAEDLNDKK